MALTVTCRCGKWFSAPDHLAGTTAACPSCGSPISIGAPGPAAAPSRAVQPAAPLKGQPAPSGLVVACVCGKSYKAPENLRGQSLPCPACGQRIPIPAEVAAQSPGGQFGLGPLGASDPLADPLMTASLTGTPVMMPAADPLGRPMAGTYGGGAPLGKPAAYEPEGPNWVIIGSIGGVALVLLILVGVIVATSLSGGGATNVASSTTPAVNVAPATEPAIPPAPAPTPNTPAVAATVPMAEIPPPQPAASTVSLAPMSPPMEFGSAGTPPTGTPPIGSSPGSPPPSTGGPGAIAAGPPKTVPTTSSTSSGPGGSSAQSGSQPGVKMVKIISRKDSKATVETPESVPANPRGFATALPVWHGDSRSKLTGVLRIGNDTRTTLQGQYSWMHNILPFMGHQDIYDKFDLKKPLHDETNMVSGCILVPEFLVPGNPKQRWEGYPFEHLALTHFVGMSGIEDARNVVAGKFDRSDPRAGIFGYERIAAPSEITDGTSNTIMVIGVGDLANPWVMGGGSTIRGARQPYFDKLSGFGSYGQKGAITMMADGSVRLISENIDPAVFRAMCTMHGAETVDLPAAAPPFKLD